jgi:hypothetical protein
MLRCNRLDNRGLNFPLRLDEHGALEHSRNPTIIKVRNLLSPSLVFLLSENDGCLPIKGYRGDCAFMVSTASLRTAIESRGK